MLSTQLLSQYRPQNGVSKSQPQSILIINAKIYKGGKAILESGSILIENDKVVSVGRTIKASEHTLVFDMEGRTILPSFIELNSSVGITPQILKKGKKYTPQTNSLKQNSFYWNQAVHPELNASDVPRLTKGKLERLFIVNMNEDFDYVTLLKKANAMRYNVSVINNTQTLLLF